MAKGFTLYMVKAVISGRVDEVVDLALLCKRPRDDVPSRWDAARAPAAPRVNALAIKKRPPTICGSSRLQLREGVIVHRRAGEQHRGQELDLHAQMAHPARYSRVKY